MVLEFVFLVNADSSAEGLASGVTRRLLPKTALLTPPSAWTSAGVLAHGAALHTHPAGTTGPLSPSHHAGLWLDGLFPEDGSEVGPDLRGEGAMGQGGGEQGL